jgi:hypothetical protein
MAKHDDIAKIRAALAAAQAPGPDMTFLDRIIALEKAMAIVLTVLEALK